jgi:hypothetical protein
MFHVEQHRPTYFAAQQAGGDWSGNACFSTDSSTENTPLRWLAITQAKQLKNKAKTVISVLSLTDYAARPPGLRRGQLRLH